jgi:hypothetical protein
MKNLILTKIAVLSATVALPAAAFSQTSTTAPSAAGSAAGSGESSTSGASNTPAKADASSDTFASGVPTTRSAAVEGGPEGYVIEGGAAYRVDGSGRTQLDREVTLSDGTRISSSGTVTAPDGQTRTLPAGQMLGMDGKMLNVDSRPRRWRKTQPVMTLVANARLRRGKFARLPGKHQSAVVEAANARAVAAQPAGRIHKRGGGSEASVRIVVW